ncbi:nitroreductase [Streptomyces sp. Da 82-17]|uniref:nitroreductase n=1 Tax=Streptomyces sp. Da 82-17 TaxID=3377116 RepID=UPI0038D3B249
MPVETAADRLLLHRARSHALSTRPPGPDTHPGPQVTPRTGPRVMPGRLPMHGGELLDLDALLRRSLAAHDPADGRLRGVPSAGGLHPVDAHVLAGPGCTVPPGRYAYDPVAHHLVLRGPAPADAPEGALVVLTVTARRTVSHYGHRAWPLLLLDTGHAMAGLLTAAGEHGVGAGVEWCLDADADLLAAAGGMDPGWGELPLAAVHLGLGGTGGGEAALAAWAHAGGVRDSGSVDPSGVSHPELRAAEEVLRLLGRAGGSTTGTWRPGRVAVPPRSGRSAIPPLPGVPSTAQLAALLGVAGSVPGPRWCAAVGGPGPSVVELGAGKRELTVLARGDARGTLAVWAARQGWLADCGAVLLAYGCPLDAGPAQVRRYHIAAGAGAGLAQAQAAALGLRSRPVGSWQGADLGAALGGPPQRDLIVHGLALGTTRAPAQHPPTEGQLTAPDLAHAAESDRTP